MKKILNFKWELLVGLNFTIIFLMVLSLGIDKKYEITLAVISLLLIPISYYGVKVARKLMKEVWL